MEPIGGDLARHDHEFDEVRWIPFDDAPTMLTFETERALVARAAELARRDAGPRATETADRRRGRLVTDALEPPIHLTPLTDAHRELGARLIEFGGWLMPVQYGSIIEEHRTVRERVGLFDLSHMGELYVEGPEAGPALAAALVSDPPSLAIGRAQYSMICAARRRDHRRPHRLPAGRGRASWSSPTRATPRSCPTPWPSGSRGSRRSSTTARWRPGCWPSRVRAQPRSSRR